MDTRISSTGTALSTGNRRAVAQAVRLVPDWTWPHRIASLSLSRSCWQIRSDKELALRTIGPTATSAMKLGSDGAASLQRMGRLSVACSSPFGRCRGSGSSASHFRSYRSLPFLFPWAPYFSSTPPDGGTLAPTGCASPPMGAALSAIAPVRRFVHDRILRLLLQHILCVYYALRAQQAGNT